MRDQITRLDTENDSNNPEKSYADVDDTSILDLDPSEYPRQELYIDESDPNNWVSYDSIPKLVLTDRSYAETTDIYPDLDEYINSDLPKGAVVVDVGTGVSQRFLNVIKNKS